MTPAVWVAVAALAVTALVQLGGLLIWGAGLTHRVKSLEEDIKALKALPVDVAKLQVTANAVMDQLRDLNASIRWMREPAEYTSINPSRGKP